MCVCLTKMKESIDSAEGPKTYYLHGSGLIAVPCDRVNEFPRLKLEFHAEEVRMAMIQASSRKLV